MRRRANMRWDAEDEPCTRMYCLVQVDSRTAIAQKSPCCPILLEFGKLSIFLQMLVLGHIS
jgi:hypothetical protein